MKKIHTVPVRIRTEIGSAMVRISRLLKVGRGGIIPLDRLESDPVMLKVGNVLIAEGRLEVIDSRYVIRVEKSHYKPDLR